MKLEEYLEKRKEITSISRGDIFDKVKEYVGPLYQFMEIGWYPYFKPFERAEGKVAVLEGREIKMFGSNNYTGLASDKRVVESIQKAVEEIGPSATGSRFLNGNLKIHHELEGELADFIGKESALVFATGYQTNVGTISSILSKNDIAILDELDHASIIDGVRLSRAQKVVFKHNDMDDLKRVLEELPVNKGKLILVDGLFSMEGDIAPVPDIVDLAKKYNARVLVDEAHSIGVFGPHGEGVVAEFGLTDDVDIITGTFSKSLSSQGGFTASNRDVIEFIKHNGRAMIFSASLTPANTAAALTALRIMREEQWRVKKVRENGDYVRDRFREMGIDVGLSVSPIIPIIIGNPEKTLFFWQELLKRGIYVNPVFPPAVPPDRSMLRVSVMATHTKDDLDYLIESVREVKKLLFD